MNNVFVITTTMFSSDVIGVCDSLEKAEEIKKEIIGDREEMLIKLGVQDSKVPEHYVRITEYEING